MHSSLRGGAILGRAVVCPSYKDLTSGAFPQERLLSRDSNNEAKGVVSWPSGLETEALHDFFVITFQNAYALLLHQMKCVCLRPLPSKGRAKVYEVVTWLILPVVICLFQRLSHACLSINTFIL